ncbi:hypothetical protein LEP1GSC176_2169 [Leptospira kirschneri str. MMD1493]|nr:hypothetical protein LEP1GSC176_2169 [Leptospira kirschneri str. MMD1493]
MPKKIKIEELKTSFTAFTKSIGIFKAEGWISQRIFLSTGFLKTSHNQISYSYEVIFH